jgi:putative PIN family toxin of toxin-antitoxin system
MTPTPPRVVFDCMVTLQGLGRPAGPARRCLELVDAGRLVLCTSPEVLDEWDEVLQRPIIRIKFPRLGTTASDEMLRALAAKSTVITPVAKAFSVPRDPENEIYTDLAIAADADYLVTWNERHLTYLMRQDTPEGVDFCRRFPKLKIVDPVTLLRGVDPQVPPAP